MRFQLFGLFFCVLVLHGQTPLGTVSGLAVDASGGAVTAASVTLTNNDTGVRRTATTNSSGAYAFPDLPPGTYRLVADAKGFRPIETRAFAVDAYRTVRQDFKFEVASASTEVVVTEAASAVVQLESPAVGSSLAPRQIIETPTNLRSVSKNSGDSGLISSILPLTVPGVVQVGNGAKWLTPGAGATSVKVKWTASKPRSATSAARTTFPSRRWKRYRNSPPTCSPRAPSSAAWARSRPPRNPGANAFHGSLFWYLRNSGTDARNAFATTKPFQNLHNYGGTFGGPIRRDKTFFFVDFDGLKGVAATLFTPNVPTVAMRQGDFSAFAALKNPFTGVNPFVGNSIAPAFLSFPGAQIAGFPLPPAQLRRAHPHRRELSRILHRTRSPPHRRDQARSQLHRRPPRLPALRKSQGRLQYPGRALRPAAHHCRHLLQSAPRQLLDRRRYPRHPPQPAE